MSGAPEKPVLHAVLCARAMRCTAHCHPPRVRVSGRDAAAPLPAEVTQGVEELLGAGSHGGAAASVPLSRRCGEEPPARPGSPPPAARPAPSRGPGLPAGAVPRGGPGRGPAGFGEGCLRDCGPGSGEAALTVRRRAGGRGLGTAAVGTVPSLTRT